MLYQVLNIIKTHVKFMVHFYKIIFEVYSALIKLLYNISNYMKKKMVLMDVRRWSGYVW
jgi:hypothetical protein